MQRSENDFLPRVLVVDDDALVARGLARSLGRENQVTTALSGLLALDIVLSSASKFAVILCDFLMPGMSGAEFYAELTERAPDMAGRVIFLSGDVSSARAAAFFDGVPNVHLEKPVDIEVLRSAVREAAVGLVC
jgi:CheY-like chemotaxis protein